MLENVSMKTCHKPVLLKETINFLNLHPGDNIIDCTFGSGGHSREILKKILPNGNLLAIDANQDTKKIIINNNFNKNNFKLITDNFKNLKNIVKKIQTDFPPASRAGSQGQEKTSAKAGLNNISGILIDLGLSSDELETSGRGFSFQKNESLDMRFGIQQDLTAADILNSYSLENLYAVFKNFGDYPHAGNLSKVIFRQRKLKKFKTTHDLLNVIPARHQMDKIHPATKIFKALRIEVNHELNNLKEVLPQAIDILEHGGRLVVISFHSLEDRIVKNYFKDNGRGENKILNILTKKPIIATVSETKNNPRSRSAKLRCAEKI